MSVETNIQFKPQHETLSRVARHDVEIDDAYRNDHFGEVSRIVAELSALGFHGNPEIDPSRKRTSQVDLTNPATQQLTKLLGQSFVAWHSTIPTAAALAPIYNPEMSQLPNGHPISPELRIWFENLYDGIGIRSRAETMEQIIVGEALQSSDQQRWLSLGSGAAQPVFQSLDDIRKKEGKIPHITLVDLDTNALDLAKKFAQKNEYSNTITTVKMNILRPEGIAATDTWSPFRNMIQRSRGLRNDSFDVVDAVGILEYLKKDNWNYSYKGVISTKQEMAGAVTFLCNAYDMVKPGGLLLVGNMRDTHPQLGFTLNTIQWPHIQPRSIETMEEIIREAGLIGELDIYCPQDGVYALYALRKPMTT